MAEFTLRPKAIADLGAIWDYTVETWGEEQAERYLHLINQGFRKTMHDRSPTEKNDFYAAMQPLWGEVATLLAADRPPE